MISGKHLCLHSISIFSYLAGPLSICTSIKGMRKCATLIHHRGFSLHNLGSILFKLTDDPYCWLDWHQLTDRIFTDNNTWTTHSLIIRLDPIQKNEKNGIAKGVLRFQGGLMSSTSPDKGDKKLWIGVILLYVVLAIATVSLFIILSPGPYNHDHDDKWVNFDSYSIVPHEENNTTYWEFDIVVKEVHSVGSKMKWSMVEISIDGLYDGDHVWYLAETQPSVYNMSEYANYSINDGICVYYQDTHGPVDSVSKLDTVIIIGISSKEPIYYVNIRTDNYIIGTQEIKIE